MSAGRRDALLDALWAANGVHAATTMAVLLLQVAEHVRQRPNFDAFGLDHLVHWLDDLRARQPDNAEPVVGRAAMNRLIDEIIDAFEGSAPTTQEPDQIPAAKAG